MFCHWRQELLQLAFMPPALCRLRQLPGPKPARARERVSGTAAKEFSSGFIGHPETPKPLN